MNSMGRTVYVNNLSIHCKGMIMRTPSKFFIFVILFSHFYIYIYLKIIICMHYNTILKVLGVLFYRYLEVN